MSMRQRGGLIVLEGLDRAAWPRSATHAFSRYKVCIRRRTALKGEDRSTPIGASISSYLKGASELEDHAIHLLFSANRWEAVSRIVGAIGAGTTVVIDRYYYSGIVYTAAKNKPDLGLQWCKAPDVGLPKPDLILFLDLDAETQSQRGDFGEERYERAEMQARVRKLFQEVISMEEKSAPVTVTVDASKDIDTVSNDISQEVDALFASHQLKDPLRHIEP